MLPQLLGDHRDARRIHLIWDNGPSHTARQTNDFLRTHYPHVRVIFTPAHASWLNQAELLLRAFAERYLRRGDWASRDELIEHLDASWPEYNRFYAHPFTWSWTRAKMRSWVDRHLLSGDRKIDPLGDSNSDPHPTCGEAPGLTQSAHRPATRTLSRGA